METTGKYRTQEMEVERIITQHTSATVEVSYAGNGRFVLSGTLANVTLAVAFCCLNGFNVKPGMGYTAADGWTVAHIVPQ